MREGLSGKENTFTKGKRVGKTASLRMGRKLNVAEWRFGGRTGETVNAR